MSDKLVEEILASKGPVSVRELQKLCNAGKGCGSCLCDLKKFVLRSQEGMEETRRSDEKGSFPNQ